MFLFYLPLSAQTNKKTMDTIIQKVSKDRAFFDQLGQIYAPENTVEVKKEIINTVNCYWFIPPVITTKGIVIYLHGGSLGMGSIHSHKAMVTHFAKAWGVKILFPEYSLAPEKPFPHGIRDILRVYSQIRKQYPGQSVYFIGDSAGGGLAVAAVWHGNKEALPMPEAVILISAWINLWCNTDSYIQRQEKDKILSKEVLLEFAGYYHPAPETEANPALMTFSSFPPAFLLVGGHEVLYGDTENLYHQLKPVQPLIIMKEYKEQQHVWMMTDIRSEASKAAIEDVNVFLRRLEQNKATGNFVR